MSDSTVSTHSTASKGNQWFSFLGILGAILIFGLIVFIAYLPNRDGPVNADIVAERQANADEARASGIQKLSNYEVINAETGVARIPIDEAMQLTIKAYDEGNIERVSSAPPPAPAETSGQ